MSEITPQIVADHGLNVRRICADIIRHGAHAQHGRARHFFGDVV